MSIEILSFSAKPTEDVLIITSQLEQSLERLMMIFGYHFCTKSDNFLALLKVRFDKVKEDALYLAKAKEILLAAPPAP